MAATTVGIQETEERHLTVDKEPRGAPTHPILQLQGPFEESIIEAESGLEEEWIVNIDAQSRRRDLLEGANYERICGRKWRHRADERYHPLWKVISQISFGVHLLARGLAKSETEVMKILQTHVDELDEFIERTREDLLLIELDVRIRIRYVRLPLGNLDVFDEMLEDRGFRLSMVHYNELIEFAVERFSTSLNDSLKDIEKGSEAISTLWHFLGQLADERTATSCTLNAIYEAFVGNVNGWNSALSKLHKKGTALTSALSQLVMTVTEMQRRIGVASRRDMMPSTNFSAVQPRNESHNKQSSEARMSVAVDKPLPSDPETLNALTAENVPKQNERRRTMMRKSAPNLRAAKDLDSLPVGSKPECRPSSSNGTAISKTESATSAPKSQKSLSRKISSTFRSRRSVSEKHEQTQEQPAAGSSNSRIRSLSLGRLRSLKSTRKSQRPVTQETATSGNQTANQSSTRGQKLKEQLSHYFKSDGVIDAWEVSNNKDKNDLQIPQQKKKSSPLSTFRPRPLTIRSFSENRATEKPVRPWGTETKTPKQPPAPKDDSKRRSTWKQGVSEELEFNTYWLKPHHHDAPPKIPILSFPLGLKEEPEEENEVNDTKPDLTTARSL